MTMRVTMHDNVRSLYLARVNCGIEPYTNWDWADLLGLIGGETLEIDTTFLFRNQLNTKGFSLERAHELFKNLPEHKSKQCKDKVFKALTCGIRAMDWMFSEVVDDMRPLRKLCRWCHHHSDKKAESCENCGKQDHFEALG